MKVNVNLSCTIDSLADIGAKLAELEAVGQVEGLSYYKADQGQDAPTPQPSPPADTGTDLGEYAEVEPPEATDTDAAKKAQKAKRAKERRAEKAAEKATADAAETDPLEDLLGGDDETPEVDDTPKTFEDLKAAVKVAVEGVEGVGGVGIERVRELFQDFKSKASKPCKKLSDVKESDFGAVIAALAAVE